MTRLWTYSTPVPSTRWEHIGDSWRTTIAPTAPEPRMHTDPHTNPVSADSGDDTPHASPVPGDDPKDHNPYCAYPWHALACTCGLSDPPERPAAPIPDALAAAKELNAEHDRIRPDADIRRGVAVLLGVCQQLVDAGEDLLGEYADTGPPNRWHTGMQAALDAAAELGITPTDQP
jgi:hypothetical protein